MPITPGSAQDSAAHGDTGVRIGGAAVCGKARGTRATVRPIPHRGFIMPGSKQSPFKSKAGLARVYSAFGYSLQGFGSAFRHEHAFRQEAFIAAVLIPVALLLDVSGIAKAIMVASVLFVLIVELLNSAIEAAVDRVSLDHHQLAKRAKDLASAAVFLSLVNVALVWGLVLWQAYAPG